MNYKINEVSVPVFPKKMSKSQEAFHSSLLPEKFLNVMMRTIAEL
jgi:hypothetical protein